MAAMPPPVKRQNAIHGRCDDARLSGVLLFSVAVTAVRPKLRSMMAVDGVTTLSEYTTVHLQGCSLL
jgi:hypothetical protein